MYENQCVGCPPEIGCLGELCPYVKVPVYYCDQCGSSGAEYRIEGEDYCEECARAYMQDVFDGLSIPEKGEALSIDVKEIDSDDYDDSS